MFSKLNGTLKNQKLKSLWKSASYTHRHALPPSLPPGVRPSPACSQSPVGRNAGVQLPPLTRAFVFTSCAGGPSPGGSSPAPEGEDGWEAGQHRADGKGTTWLLLHHRLAAAPGSHPSEGNGSPARLCSGAATLPRSPLTPHLIRRQTEQKFLLLLWGGLPDYRSQSCDAETPPLPSTRTRVRGRAKSRPSLYANLAPCH